MVWNGRKKDGSLFPQGTYTVKQFLTAEGTTETTTHTVVLSHKKVTWYLGSQTRYADTGAFFMAGDGTVSQLAPYDPRAISLFGGNVAGGYAAGRYTFTLPSAHVYASLRVSIYGTGSTNGDGHETHGEGYVGIWNFETGHARRCPRRWATPWTWYSTSVTAPGPCHERSQGPDMGARRRRRTTGWSTYTKMKLTYKYGNLDY